MNEKQSLESTDYDVNTAGAVDKRLEAGKKDAIFLHAIGWIFTIIATIWASHASMSVFSSRTISGDSDTVCLMIISAESLSRTD